MLVGKCLCGAVRYAVESPFHYDPGIRPMFPIFVGSKAPWHEITNSLPQYAELPPVEALAT